MTIRNILGFGTSKERKKEVTKSPVVEAVVPEIVRETVRNTTIKMTKLKDGIFHITYEKKSLLAPNSFRKNTRKYTVISDYDLARAERMYEIEGTVRKAVVTATAKAMRGGFERIPNPLYPGSNRKKEHGRIIGRLDELLDDNNMIWEEFLQTTFKETWEYGNSFIRTKKDRNGTMKEILSDDPLFYKLVLDPITLRVDKYIRTAQLRPKAHSEDTFNQITGGANLFASIVNTDYLARDALYSLGYANPNIHKKKEETIDRSDMVHIRYMVEKNAAFAMPPVMPSIADIEDMRTLEENLVFLGWQYGHPILHITVDTLGMGETEATREVNEAIRAIEAMDSTGFLATSHRVSIKLHYPNGSVIPIEKFADYMGSRVKSNMDTSALLLGDGGDAGRQAGEAIEASCNDIVQMIANIVARKLERGLLYPIYMESGGKELILPTRIKVREVDRNRRAIDLNQKINMVNHGCYPPSRVVDSFGEQPLTSSEKKEIQEFLITRGANGGQGTINPQNQYGEQAPGTTKD